MFQYLGEKIPMFDTDVYHCEVWFIFVQCMCFVLFPSDVTAVKLGFISQANELIDISWRFISPYHDIVRHLLARSSGK